jgi:hypothetical protein
MASCRKTGTNESVSTYGAAGRNYTVLATWESDTDNDNVYGTVSPVLECYNDASSYDDHILMNGAINNGTYFRIIRPAAGSGTNGVNFHGGLPTAGVRFFSTYSGVVISVVENNTQIQDVVTKLTLNNTTTLDTVNADSTTISGVSFVGLLVVDCLNSGTGKINGITLSNGQGIGAVDCLVHNVEQYGINVIMQQAGYTNYAYNCTVTNSGATNIRLVSTTSGGTAKAVNCLTTGGVTSDFVRAGGTAGTVNVSYCCSSDATADDWGGAGNLISKALTFVNAAADNFHLAASDTDAINAGTDLSADPNFAFNDDIDKITRAAASWDIGFDEHTILTLAVSGGIAPAGALASRCDRYLAGSMTPSGAINGQTSKMLIGAIAPSGAIKNQALKFLAGDVAPIGLPIKIAAQKQLNGATVPNGQLARLIFKNLSGAIISIVGTLISSLIVPVILRPLTIELSDYGLDSVSLSDSSEQLQPLTIELSDYGADNVELSNALF